MDNGATAAMVQDVANPIDDWLARTQRSEDAKNHIRAWIKARRWKPGERMPTQSRLAHEMRMSKRVVSKAINDLAGEGVIVIRPRRGTYLAPEKQPGSEPVASHSYCLLVTREVGTLHPDHCELIRQGIEDATGGLGVRVITVPVGCDAVWLQRLMDQLRRPGTQHGFGLLSVPVQVKTFFQDRNIPTVVLGSRESGISIPAVDSDTKQLMRDVVELLLGSGHRQIALTIHSPRIGADFLFASQYKAVLEEWQLQKMAELPGYVAELPQKSAPVKRAVAQLLQGPNPPTALVMATDYQAVWAIQVARELGRRVPDDLAVISLADSLQCQNHQPSITAVQPHLRDKGYEGGVLLARILAGETIDSQLIAVPHELIERGTTKAVRASLASSSSTGVRS